MRFLKLMTYCTILSSFVLVGCNKDNEDIVLEPIDKINTVDRPIDIVDEMFPVLETGVYTHMQDVTIDCQDKNNNGSIIMADCANEGCFQLDLKEDGTLYLLTYNESSGAQVVLEGVYTITDDKFTGSYRTTMSAEEASVVNGIITGENKFYILNESNEDRGCAWRSELVK